MATAIENLNEHLQLAVRQLKIIGTVNEIPDSTFELVDEIYGLLLSFTTGEEPHRAGIPSKMRGSEIVAALKGIVNTTTLNTQRIKLTSADC